MFRAIAGFSERCSEWLAGDCVTGLVPTMGALHDGHRRLIERARAECDRVAVTVFVNPLQFGAGEDFEAYPRGLLRDVELCRAAGADAVFAPDAGAMYGADFCSRIAVGAAAAGMEGAVRPGHFEGVATVVAKLLAIARPQRAYFGEKDAQQLAVIRRLVDDLGFATAIVPCAIVREPDGLAMSSRNVYLEPGDRAAATVLWRSLQRASAAFAAGERDRDALLGLARAELAAEPRAAVDYVELRRENDLAALPPGPIAGGRMLLAVRFVAGERPVRLIDNLALASGS
ncbi:MAG: pantoate--beta-alanine ligase [Planctomycetes bacterium]|nr:pantoate--beta-alanine ligase [Planctomycetota bacterium]